MENYKKILFILLGFLFLNIAYSLNSYGFKKDILETVSFQTFKDIKAKDNSLSDEEKTKAKLAIEKYIENTLHDELKKRNDIVEGLLFLNIISIIACLSCWLIHYTMFYTNKKEILVKSLIILSIIWLLLIAPIRSYEIRQFIGMGIIPIILIFGIVWVYFAYSKNNTN